MTSVLTAVRETAERVAAAVAECRRLGIAVPPDAHRSDVDFTVDGDAIRFGLQAVKNVGQGAIESIIAARDEGGDVPLADRLLHADRPAPGQSQGARGARPRRGARVFRAPGPDPARAGRRPGGRRGDPARPADRPDLPVRDGRRCGCPRRSAAERPRDAHPGAPALGEGAARAVPVRASDGRDRRGHRAVRDRLLERPPRRVARRAAGGRRRHRDRRPDGHHQGQGDDGDRHAGGPAGHDRGGRLPAAVEDRAAGTWTEDRILLVAGRVDHKGEEVSLLADLPWTGTTPSVAVRRRLPARWPWPTARAGARRGAATAAPPGTATRTDDQASGGDRPSRLDRALAR